MDDSMKKALGGRAVLRKLPRLLKGMLLMLCLLSVSLSEVQADLWEQKRSMEMENTSIGEKACSRP